MAVSMFSLKRNVISRMYGDVFEKFFFLKKMFSRMIMLIIHLDTDEKNSKTLPHLYTAIP